MAESGRGTREALAMLQAQFNQIGGSFREMGEARRGREHEAGLLDTRLKEEGYQKSVAQRSAERIAELAQRGAGERLDITEESARQRADRAFGQGEQQHQEMMARYGQERGTELFNAMIDLEMQYRIEVGDPNWADADWKAKNKQRYHDMYINKLSTLGLTQDEMASVENSFEAFWTGEPVDPPKITPPLSETKNPILEAFSKEIYGERDKARRAREGGNVLEQPKTAGIPELEKEPNLILEELGKAFERLKQLFKTGEEGQQQIYPRREW